MTVSLDVSLGGVGPGLEEIARPAEELGLLEKFGGVLARGKEELHAAGRTVKEHLDLILLGTMYSTVTATPPTILLAAANNPETARRLFPESLFGNAAANVTPESAYLMFVVTAIVFGVPYAQIFYNRFKTGRPFGL